MRKWSGLGRRSTEDEIHSGEEGAHQYLPKGPKVKHGSSGKNSTICSPVWGRSHWPAAGPHSILCEAWWVINTYIWLFDSHLHVFLQMLFNLRVCFILVARGFWAAGYVGLLPTRLFRAGGLWCKAQRRSAWRLWAEPSTLCFTSLRLPVDRVSTDCIAQPLRAPVTKPVTRTLMGICSNSPVNH